MGRNYDQIGFLRFGDSHDLVGHISVTHHDADSRAVLYLADQLRQLLIGIVLTGNIRVSPSPITLRRSSAFGRMLAGLGNYPD